jgi:hypothetical protein
MAGSELARRLSVALPNVIGRCPVCANELTITRLHCPACDTTIEGHFLLGRYASLPNEQLAFLDTFVRNRGIIKDVEAELGISYRTVVSRLDDLFRALGYPTGDDNLRPRQVREIAREERRQILEDLREKRISADEAARRMSGIGDR